MKQRSWQLRNAEQTRAAGQALGRVLQQVQYPEALIITLSGELGAGKTTLVGGVLSSLGVAGPVRSPTYTLIEPYELSGIQVYHLDLYRLTDPLQLEELGLRDLLLPGNVLLVEWAERGGNFFAHPDISIQLEYPSIDLTGRQLTLKVKRDSLGGLLDSLSF